MKTLIAESGPRDFFLTVTVDSNPASLKLVSAVIKDVSGVYNLIGTCPDLQIHQSNVRLVSDVELVCYLVSPTLICI